MRFGIFTRDLPVLSDGEQVPPQVDQRGRLIVSSGDNNEAGVLTVVLVEIDTDGEIVPTHRGHSYTYDDSGNVATDTVTGDEVSWVRTYEYGTRGVIADSGWVRQQ